MSPCHFSGKRQQILGEERQFLNVDAELAGAGAEQIAAHADVVADVEQLVELEALSPTASFLT